MAIYMLCMTRGALYMFLINGVGKVKLQMIVYLVLAVISIPIMVITSRRFGLVSVIIFGALVYLIQAIFGQIQLKKILAQQSSGIWSE